MPLLRLDIGSLLQGLVGSSEGNTRAALRLADAISPAVLWIDEIEKGFSGMNGGGENDGGVARRILGIILTWMPVYVVATANDVRALPPELLSRFDDIFFADTPSRRGRAEIFAIHLQKRGLAPDLFDIAALVEATDGYTGREIEKIVRQAMRRAFYDGARPVTTADLLDVARMIVPATRTNLEQVRALREWAASRAIPASSPDPSEKGRRSGLEL